MEVNEEMPYAVDPRQKPLFDTAENMSSPVAIKYMRGDWPGLFRTQILHLMPVGKPAPGLPTAVYRTFSVDSHLYRSPKLHEPGFVREAS